MIELDAVRKVYQTPSGDPLVAVENVSLVVGQGEVLSLIGPSGCGKTTTLKMINRLVEPSSGVIHVGGEDVVQQDLIRLRRRIGYVVQNGGLFPHLNVFENVALLLKVEGVPLKEIRTRVGELLRLVNLEPSTFSRRFPNELSGGERQRVGIARALSLNPSYVLLDEPFGALDPMTRLRMHDEFLNLRAKVKKTMLLVTHDMSEAFKMGDRVALMRGGALVQLGVRSDFELRPANAFVTRFLGELFEGADG